MLVNFVLTDHGLEEKVVARKCYMTVAQMKRGLELQALKTLGGAIEYRRNSSMFGGYWANVDDGRCLEAK